MNIRFAILTASDRCARGERDDLTGPALADLVRTQNWSVVKEALLPDDRSALSNQMSVWADGGEVDVILVTGGTGFAPRDVTPEATRAVIDREAPGLAEAMRAASLSKTPHAMLSRSVSGLRGRTLIINLPGSPKGALENLQAVIPVLEHAIKLLREEDAGH
jgi:molybdenum cofactor synthesis domain-containing protein